MRPRNSPPRVTPKPHPSRRPRAGSSTARLGGLLLCFAAAGAALLLWGPRLPGVNWVAASFAELVNGSSAVSLVPDSVRGQAERVCSWSRDRFPRLASGAPSSRLFFLHPKDEGAYLDCGQGSWKSVGILSSVYLRTCIAGGDPCDTGVGGFATAMLLDGKSRSGCGAVVLLPPEAGTRRFSDDGLRRTVVHEYVIHCGLARYLTTDEKESFLERIAERVPHTRLRAWFGDPGREAYYRHRHGVGPDLVTPAGYVDVSASNPFVTKRERALGYVEEAFAALVDEDLGIEYPRRTSPRDHFEVQVHAFADLLLGVAEGKAELSELAAAVESL